MSPLRTANMNGVDPAFDRWRMSAPPAMSASTTAPCPSAAAQWSGDCPFQLSRAFTLAPARSSMLTASTLPARAACISGVSSGVDVVERVVRIGAGLHQLADDVRVAVFRGERERRNPVVVPDVDLRAGADELRDGVRVLRVSGPVQRGGAVGLSGIDVGLLRQQRLHRLLVLRCAASASGALDVDVGAAANTRAPVAPANWRYCCSAQRHRQWWPRRWPQVTVRL